MIVFCPYLNANMTRETVSDLCGSCNKVIKDGEKAILCEGYCKKWWHIRCGDISTTQYRELSKTDEPWWCKLCSALKSYGTQTSDADMGDLESLTVDQLLKTLILEQREVVRRHMEIPSVLQILNLLQQDLQEVKRENELLKQRIGILEGYSNNNNGVSWSKVVQRGSYNSIKFDRNTKNPTQTFVSKNRFETLNEVSNNGRELSPQEGSKDTQREGKRLRRKSKKKLKNKVKIYADSHGRNLAVLIREQDGHSMFDVEATVKPGAKMEQITSQLQAEAADLSDGDFVVVAGGSNDVYSNETTGATNILQDALGNLTHTNVIVLNIPYRHDLKDWSIVNKEIEEANTRINQICSHFKNVTVVDTSNYPRLHHTRHGGHLNAKGKKELCNRVSTIIRDKSLGMQRNEQIILENGSENDQGNAW